ncbi:MAG: Hsp20/alpha crystallin family protein [Victivallales bacterium]|nr:Hsp20/alpha crystallin family protein [Victivallales bacterium]
MATDKQLQKKQARDVEKAPQAAVEETQDRPVFVPFTDIYEDKNSFALFADMPGVDDKNVDITLEENVLTIVGHQKAAVPEGLELIYRGYQEGMFKRSFTISAPIDRDKISAKIKNGVLGVSLPKAEEAKPRKIAVSS